MARARYAAWLATKYLEGTNLGLTPLMLTLGTFLAPAVSKHGIKYHGSRPYQPGDSPKTMDWKHSVKLHELVSKDFSELRGQSALILINLSVVDAEEADKLAYKIVTTPLSLAQENIPSALATYDHGRVRRTTCTLAPAAILTKSLEVAREIVIFADPLKYLAPRMPNDFRQALFVSSNWIASQHRAWLTCFSVSTKVYTTRPSKTELVQHCLRVSTRQISNQTWWSSQHGITTPKH